MWESVFESFLWTEHTVAALTISGTPRLIDEKPIRVLCTLTFFITIDSSPSGVLAWIRLQLLQAFPDVRGQTPALCET